LQQASFFENVTITESDRNKTKQYRAQVKRRLFKKKFSDLTDYYRSLAMKAEIRTDDLFVVKRLAQLTQKTNQFNLTTRRYSEKDIEKFIVSDSFHVIALRLQDRFGDNGITGLAIIDKRPQHWRIDTLLLSCRIIGRTAETALLAHIYSMAKEQGVPFITGEYIPTPKNALVKDIYKKHGFYNEKGRWVLDVNQTAITFPEWIERV
jgi:FkbH-like protein